MLALTLAVTDWHLTTPPAIVPASTSPMKTWRCGLAKTSHGNRLIDYRIQVTIVTIFLFHNVQYQYRLLWDRDKNVFGSCKLRTNIRLNKYKANTCICINIKLQKAFCTLHDSMYFLVKILMIFLELKTRFRRRQHRERVIGGDRWRLSRRALLQ